MDTEITKEQIIHDLLKTGKYKKCRYLNEYASLIYNQMKENKHKSKGLHKHHIVPKAVCNELKWDTNYNGHNTVYMTEEVHTTAHNLLALSAKDINIANQARGCGNVSADTIKKHIGKRKCKK